MANGLVKGSGVGTREWSTDFELVNDSGTSVFKVAKSDGAVTMAGAVGFTGKITADELSLASATPVSHLINLEGATLAANTNAIRGASVNPTRTSGWISFSGTAPTGPGTYYSDFRQLTTAGTSEVLGVGTFPTMASGASCASMFGVQSICQIDSGATWLTGGSAAAVGMFPIFAKLTQSSATINSGAQGAAIYADVNGNVTSFSGKNISGMWLEASSGEVPNLFYVNSTSHAGFDNFVKISAADKPFVSTGCTVAATTYPYLKVTVGSTVYGIPLIAI